jgi:hypothetical protein
MPTFASLRFDLVTMNLASLPVETLSYPHPSVYHALDTWLFHTRP